MAKFGETLPATELGVDSAIGEPIAEVSGRMRCMEADLIVVDNLACLYDCPDDDMLRHVFAVFGRGASVVALSTWNLAARNPDNVPPTRVIRHRPLAIQKRVAFVADSAFQTREASVIRVLEALAGLAKSRWTLQKSATSVSVSEEAHKTTPKHEFVHLHDLGRLRAGLEQHACTENFRGQRVWTLEQRMI